MRYGANRQSIVADHMLPGADYIRTRSAAFLILQLAPLQPVVQRGLSTIEVREIVVGAQLLRRA
jgi:hypothetical protein